MTEIYIDDETMAFIPYLSIVIGLSKIKADFQKILNLATELTHASQEEAATFLDFNNKEIYLFYLSFRILIQNYSAYSSDDDSSTLFVYEDFDLNRRLSNETFLNIRNKAASVLLNMKDLSILQKVAVLTGFLLISKSGSANANYGTAVQLQAFRKNAWDYLTDQLYFAEKGIHIKEAAKMRVEQWKLKLFNDFLVYLNAINNAALSAYEKLDKTYADLLSITVNKIQFEFEKARKKAIRKSAKNLKIGIAAMVITACVAPYVSALIGTTVQISALTGIEALLASLVIDTVTSAAIFTGTEAVLNNDYKGFYKKFTQQVAIELGSKLTAALVASKSGDQIIKGSTEAVKVSAASSAVKNALQTLFNKGKFDDTIKAILMGGVSGAVAEKLTTEFHNYNADLALDNITKCALEDGLHSGIQSAINSIEIKNARMDTYGCLLNGLAAGLSSYLTGNIMAGVQSVTEKKTPEAQSIGGSSQNHGFLQPAQTIFSIDNRKTYFFGKQSSIAEYSKGKTDSLNSKKYNSNNECFLLPK